MGVPVRRFGLSPSPSSRSSQRRGGPGLPAQLTIINSSGADLKTIRVASDDEQFTIGHIANGEFRRFSLSPDRTLTIECGDLWFPSGKLTPAQSLVVYVVPGPRLEARSRLGTLTR